ncbi:UDP-N-acetylglucosamine--N-acetylmuramyl-(pentapeptide) pyrophosphoryl-undecaprenol N-acetylglucosamine transferase [Candidatus Sumerlaeota bacterium]|nr:UDP-N-acetylglucosamine--N-acetylmuramyl-(pentapeptide) pyrophosphoryl-undecaprenol N-acetylglucosamine transferase [Candidatus Sumerlaeota bacterium]
MADRPPDSSLRIAIAAGGTGGHIMPALALGEALGNIGHSVRIDYICGNRPVELDIYSKSGVMPRVFPVGSITEGGWLRRAWQYVGLAYTFLRSLLMIRRYDVVVGMGGYTTGPVLSAALLCRVPIVIHESNTVLGRVNRRLAPRARILACGLPLVAKPENVDPARIHVVGTPVRLFITKGSRAEAAETMYLQPDAFTLFVCGGSQGARGLNGLMARTLGHLSGIWPSDRPFQVVWATGAKNIESVREQLENERLRGQLFLAPTIERMDHAFAMADLAVGRAGGSWLAEIALCGIPSILVPLPHGADRHQHHNAEILVRHKAALGYEQDIIEPRELARQILELANDSLRLEMMASAARTLARPDAARDLARLVVETATARKA